MANSDRRGGLCTFMWSIFHFLPCGIIWSSAPCHAVRGRLTRRIWFRPFRSRVPVLVLLSCDRPSALCMLGRPVFRFLPCGIIRSGALCCAMQGRLTERVQVRLFCSMAPISVLISCDCPGALCTFERPIYCFLPCFIFIRSGTSCRAV